MIINLKKSILIIVFIVIIGFVLVSIPFRDDASPDGEPAVAGSSRLSELLGSAATEGYPQVLNERAFEFPLDHGPHPRYRNEWWYITGNLDGAGGERFGFELTIFRFAIAPQGAGDNDTVTAWDTNQVYIGHFAVSDALHAEFHVAERYSRGAAGLAGATATPLRVWIDDWEIQRAAGVAETWSLRASDENFALDLQLDAVKAPVLNGRNGLSQKSSAAGNASYYYSMTRLQSTGSLRVRDTTFAVDGLSWIDREWGSSALSPDQVGWDWFALQLDDGSELMYYNLRRNDGSRDPHSAGTFVSPDGSALYLSGDAVQIRELDHWENERGDRYPVAWSLEVPRKRLRLEISPLQRNQELSTSVRYWEGAVDIAGTANAARTSGRGYVELTGYAR